jgi:hypothetical protein
MKYSRNSKILLCMTALSVCLLIVTACGQDYLDGGYVRSFDRSMLMDPGIAGMVWWLDQPVSNPPRYSSDIAFYKQSVPDTTLSPFREYQYAAAVPSKTNDLWIQGATNRTQYVAIPIGTWLQLVAHAPVGGPAGFYEMIQTDTTSSKYSIYQFNQGYNTMNFQADQIGRHMLYFVINSQPSNVVVVDVLARAVQ